MPKIRDHKRKDCLIWDFTTFPLVFASVDNDILWLQYTPSPSQIYLIYIMNIKNQIWETYTHMDIDKINTPDAKRQGHIKMNQVQHLSHKY
jgi:hypothetical protein